MNNYTGVRAIGFISVILGSATFGVCSWIFLTYKFGDSTTSLINNGTLCFPQTTPLYLQSSSISKPLLVPPIKPSACHRYLEGFLEMFSRNSFFASITSVFQVAVSIHLMTSTAQEAITRAKLWTMLSLGFNLIYLLCFTSPFTYSIPMELGRRNAAIALSNVHYLSSYYIILELDIFMGFMMLIATMLMIRLDNKMGYALVHNI